jgi:Tfp pilus assembly protein PilE
MALAGLVFGYISVALVPIILILASIAIPTLLQSRQAVNEAAAIANLRSVANAETSYRSGPNAKYADLEGLIEAKLLDESFRDQKTGYNFTIVASETAYTATATPATSAAGRFGFYATTDGVVRYSTQGVLAPTGQAGLPAN